EVFVEQPWLQLFDHTSLTATIGAMLKGWPQASREPARAAERVHPHGFAGVVAWDLLHYLVRIPGAMRDWKGHSSSLLSIRPLRERLRGENGHAPFLHPERVARSGIRLRLATVCLETGETRYVTESGTIVSQDDTQCLTGTGEPVDLVSAGLASA